MGAAEGEVNSIIVSIKVLPRVRLARSLDSSTYSIGDLNLGYPFKHQDKRSGLCTPFTTLWVQAGLREAEESQVRCQIHSGSLDLMPTIPRAEETMPTTQGADWLWHVTKSISDWLLKKKMRSKEKKLSWKEILKPTGAHQSVSFAMEFLIPSSV